MKKDLRELVSGNCEKLENSAQTLSDIYNITFSAGDAIMTESNDGYRIIRYSYRQIREMIEDAAEKLYARLGAAHEYVALEMENCVEWIVAFWAILRSGNKPYLVNCRHPKKLSDQALKTLSIRHIVALKTGILDGEYVIWGDLTEKKSVSTDVFEDELVLATSATSMNETICFYTGRELAAQILNARGILARCDRLSRHYHGSLKQLAFLPFYHVFGLIAVYFWFTFFSRTLVFLRDYSGDTLLLTCKKHEVTHVFAVPMLWTTIETQLHRQLSRMSEKEQKAFETGVKLSLALQNVLPGFGAWFARRVLLKKVTDKLFGPSIQFCISGGSYLKDSTLRLFNAIGYSLHNGYGASEIGITSFDLRMKPRDLCKNSVGVPFDSIEYRIGDRKTLLVKGKSTCHRLLINSENIPMPEWFDTRDIAEIVGGEYYIRGRESDLVIGEDGENINPDVIEQAFDLNDALQYCVLGLDDGDGERLCMVVRISRYLPIPRIQALIDALRCANNTLPLSSAVRSFYISYDALASETAVKVSRAYLKQKISDGSVKLIPIAEFADLQEGDQCPEDSPIAKKLREIFAGELGVSPEEIAINAHFMLDLGGTSLQYMSVLSAISRDFSISEIDASREAPSYTIAELCKTIERYI